MTVQTDDNRIIYPADGIKVDFDFNFKTDTEDTIFVYEDGVPTPATVIVTLNPDQEIAPGGSVNITPAIPAPIVITIQREEDFFQLTKYPIGGDFPSASHERALDKNTKLVQQINDKFNRTVRADINEPLSGISLIMPNADGRKNGVLGFGASGEVIIVSGVSSVPVSVFMAPILLSGDAEAARLGFEAMAGFKYIPVAGTDTYTASNTPAHTNYRTNVVYFGNFVNPNTATVPTWDIDGIGARDIVSKDGSPLVAGEIGGDHFLLYNGVNFRLLNPNVIIPPVFVPAGYKNGLVISNSTVDNLNDITVAVGEAADTDAGFIMKLLAPLTKQIDATWVEGEALGGMFQGSVAINTWYHIHLIRKDSDGTIDAGFDTSVTAANIPAGWTAYLRIGAVYRNNGSVITTFKQYKDRFVLTPAIVNSNSGSSRNQLEPVMSPPDVQTIAHLHLRVNDSSANIYLSDADRGDDTITLLRASGSDNSSWIDAVTNTSSQVWININAGVNIFAFNSIGWTELW